MSIFIGASVAHAASVSIQLMSSSPSVDPGQTISFEASANGFSNPTYSLSDSFSGSSVSSSDINNAGYFSWTPGLADAGVHQITVTATDASNDSANSTITIPVLSNVVLVQNLEPGALIGIGRTLTFSISAPGFIDPAFTVGDTYQGTSITSADVDSSGGFSWTPAVNQQGPHLITVYGYDAYGHGNTASQSVLVTDPQISTVSMPAGGTVGTPIVFTATASGLATTTFSVSDAFIGISTISNDDISDAGVFSWTPSASDVGVHPITITADDAFGNSASMNGQLVITAAPASIATAPPLAATTTSTSAAPPAPVPPAAAATGTAYHFTDPFGFGSYGAAVTALQQLLIDSGYPLPAGATGNFGAQTESAVAAFQQAHAVPGTGYVGPLTLAVLNQSAAPAASGGAGSGLTAAQASAIISLLQSFGADAGTIANVEAALAQ